MFYAKKIHILPRDIKSTKTKSRDTQHKRTGHNAPHAPADEHENGQEDLQPDLIAIN